MKAIVFIWMISLSLGIFSQSGKVELLSYTTSECMEEDDLYRLKNRIVSQEILGDAFLIELAVVANCCGADEGEVSMKDGALHLIYHGKYTHEYDSKGNVISTYSEACDCDCCFHLNYIIRGVTELPAAVYANDKPIEFSEEKYKTYPIKYQVVDGDTINFYDNYGNRQGRHVETNDLRQVILDMHFTDGKETNGVKKSYHFSGYLETEKYWTDGNYNRIVTYFKSGKIQEDCDMGPALDFKRTCRRYDQEGNLLDN
jgi:hypothetical protein